MPTHYPCKIAFCVVAGVLVARADALRYVINPNTFALGKTYTITIQDTKCVGDADLSAATVFASGSGITLTDPNPLPKHKCDRTETLAVNETAETGDFNIVVQTASESVLSSIKIVGKAVGPIPPGLQPTVDVAWGVLPRRVASDNFGGRITKLYYPIQVVIGNNSGYDLQLVSVQFKLPDAAMLDTNVPTDSYYMVRSSLQREQLIGVRNTTMNIIKAIGPILTGSAVFFDGTTAASLNHKSTFQSFTNIFSNPFEKGVELVFPDETVQQLINLDNHTLRDGIIIANNTQIRTVVFVNKDLLVKSAATNGAVLPNKSQATVRRAADAALGDEIAAAEKMLADEFTSADNTLRSEIARAEVVRSKKMSMAEGNRDPIQAATDKAAAASEAQGTIAAAAQRASVAKAAASERAAIAKRAAIRASGRMEAKVLGGGGKFSKKEYDQQEVMRQLGSLQLIGRSIAYLNRVSVISNPPGVAPQFTLTPISITQAPTGNDSIALTLVGSALTGGTLSASDKTLVISNQKVADDGKSFIATLDASKADPGLYVLTLTTPSGSQSARFEVKPADIAIDKTQTPGITVKAGDSDVLFTVTGSYLKNVDNQKGVTNNCVGTAINIDDSQSPDDKNLHIKISAASSVAANSNCTATVTGKSGNTQDFTYAVTK